MRKKSSAKGPKGLGRITRQIVKNFCPEKVILFGSYAYGNPSKDSDVDLLVVLNTREKLARVSGKISALIDHPFPIDILVKTPTQVQKRLAIDDPLIKEALSKGVVLYEADD